MKFFSSWFKLGFGVGIACIGYKVCKSASRIIIVLMERAVENHSETEGEADDECE